MGQTASSHPSTVDAITRVFRALPTAQTHRAVAPATPREPVTPGDVAIGDWDDLFSAVKARLRQTVGGVLAAVPEQQGADAARQVRASVLDCVNALDQLHLTLTHELRRRDCEWPARPRNARDSLTALPNRSRFHARLKQALADSELRQGPALVCLDLDDFAAINEEHGHEAGDEVLRIVAARLVRTVRVDDMVSRLGGDEFACVLSDAPGREQLERLACKLCDAVAAPMQVGALSLSIRASMGIAVCPADGVCADTLLKSAGDAVYRTKRQKTGYAFFNETSGPRSREIG